MNDYQEISPSRAAKITERINQAFEFLRDVIDEPATLEHIPDGATLRTRTVVIGDVEIRLTAYQSPDDPQRWTARVTGPAHLAAEGNRWRPPAEAQGMAGKWGSPPTSPEGGETAEAALDALEMKLRDSASQFLPARA